MSETLIDKKIGDLTGEIAANLRSVLTAIAARLAPSDFALFCGWTPNGENFVRKYGQYKTESPDPSRYDHFAFALDILLDDALANLTLSDLDGGDRLKQVMPLSSQRGQAFEKWRTQKTGSARFLDWCTHLTETRQPAIAVA